MNRAVLSAAAALVLAATAPAGAFFERQAAPTPAAQYGSNNDRMPFPRLMNSLFGGDRHAAPAPRYAPPPRQAVPVPRIERFRDPFPQPGFVRPSPRIERHGAPVPRIERAPGRPDVAARHPVPMPAPRTMDPRYERQVVDYSGSEAPGTVVIDTSQRYLFLVQEGGTALRYGVGVGREGFSWTGTEKITRKAEWPDWRPPAEMRKRQPGLPVHMAGGPDNPLGARALYLGNTLYRIHGSNEPWTIGRAVSSGCIRMRNEDVIDLYDRVGTGTMVKVI